jgi:hypothetical protein
MRFRAARTPLWRSKDRASAARDGRRCLLPNAHLVIGQYFQAHHHGAVVAHFEL